MIYVASACFLDSKNTPVSKIDQLKYTFPCFHELLTQKTQQKHICKYQLKYLFDC